VRFMARLLRIQYAGAIYHVTVKSNGKEELFGDDTDRRYFLSRVAEAAESHKVRVYLLCLMENHTHPVIETANANLSRFMHAVLTGYATHHSDGMHGYRRSGGEVNEGIMR